jgi:uncharacterized repeat protein (TIGR03843 family)
MAIVRWGRDDLSVSQPIPAPAGTDPGRLLSEGRMRLLGLMPFASNYTYLAEVTGRGERVLAVYKPRRGEMPLWDFPDGTLCRREVAAYRLSQALGWPRIPFTLMRDGPHGPGAVQLFVEADLAQHFFTLREERVEDFRAIAAFDAVANNADRKAGHCLLAADGSIWAVDHGVCFSVEPKLRTVIWDFAGQTIPPDLVRDLRRVARELRSGQLRDAMSALLSTVEVDAAARRAEALATSRRFPAPGGGRSYPWPPV